MSFQVPMQYRVVSGPMGTDDSDGNNGAFLIPVSGKSKRQFVVIASDGGGWEHVSISLPDRVPSWDEMCRIKAMFWGEEDCVVQYHPPKAAYVNNHPYCLHLWRPANDNLPTPPSWMVGFRSSN